ncbi:MAG: CDP-alcohol phosphatidyltransferase family protein [Bacteroidales bacterium]
MEKKEQIVNLPNVISFYRLIVFPLILWFAWSGNEKMFVIFICISLVSDILDGFIARTFKMVTKFGAQMDNLADLGTYILALYGIFRFRWDALQPHAWILYLFLAIFALTYVVAWIRFRKIPGLHLYGAVIAGYLQGLFLFVLFLYGFIPWFFYLAIGWGVLAYIEKFFVLIHLDDIRANTKGLYWLLKKKKREQAD